MISMPDLPAEKRELLHLLDRNRNIQALKQSIDMATGVLADPQDAPDPSADAV
jgi:hypothetical protein